MKPRRPPHGLVHCGAERVVRVDVDEAGAVVRTVERARSGDDTADAVEAVLDAPLPERLWVLDERLWTQTLALPAQMVEGLDDAQVAKALSYELEPISGIHSATAEVAFVPSPSNGSERRLWVTVVPRACCDRLTTLLADHGASLAGIAHPAGVARDHATPAIEVWEGATCCFAGAARDDGQLVIGASAGQRSWERGLSEWLDDAPEGTIEWRGRARPDLVPATERAAELVDRGPLADGPDEVEWLRRALTALSTTPAKVPTVQPTAAPRRRLGPRGVGAVLLAVVLVILAVDATRLVRRAGDVETEVAALEGRAGDAGTLRRSAASLETRRQQLARDVAALDRKVGALDAEWITQAHRLRTLLDAAAALRPDALVLESLAPTPAGDLALAGVSVEQAEIDRFADDLGDRLTPDGWKIRPAKIESIRTDSGAHVFGFRITAVPTRPAVTP